MKRGLVPPVPSRPSLLATTLALALALAAGAASAATQAPPGIADSTAMDWSRVPEYRLVPGDQLRINFGPRPDGLEDLTRDAKVRPDGRISVYPMGDVVAAGLTPRELEESLVSMLSAEFKQPRITVEVTEIAGNKVHVLGRVKRPGSFEADPFMTVVQAITAAGGFEDDASRNSVLVFHRDGRRTVRVERVAVDRALKKGSLLADLPLSRFDIVYVPRSTIGNIDVFTRQFFAEPGDILSTALTGWELFNLDRVFVVGRATR